MKRTADGLRAWWPACLWMAVIFWLSTGSMSAPGTSRFLGPIFRWIAPGLSDIEVDRLVFLTRKGAHMFEYAVLAGLLWRGHRTLFTDRSTTRAARFAFIASVVYAATDELHQYFEPARQASLTDIGLDALGAAGAVLVLYAAAHRRPAPGRNPLNRGNQE